ncbi:MAG: hypothetical protein R3B13_03290 [Polyangiaceae bacterium]
MFRLVLLGALAIGCAPPEFSAATEGDAATGGGGQIGDSSFGGGSGGAATGGMDGGTGAVASTGGTGGDAAAEAGCANPQKVTLVVEADTFLVESLGVQSINYGDSTHLKVQEGGNGAGSVALFRFQKSAVVDSAIAEGRIISMALRLVTSLPAEPTGGSVAVHFMRADWDEGKGSYTGATWKHKNADCSSCGSVKDDSCCKWGAEWQPPGGGSGTPDRVPTPAGSAVVTALGSQPVTIPLVGPYYDSATQLSVQVVPNDATVKVWFAAVESGVPGSMEVTYCP